MKRLVTRRSVLAGGAVLAVSGVPAFGSAAARPRIEPLADRIRVHFGGRVTEVRISVAGVASVVSCPPEHLATGGGLFANANGPAPELRTEVLRGTVRLIASGIIIEVDEATGQLRFLDEKGSELLREAPEPPAMPAVTGSRRHAFTIGADEPLHGLGQFREPVFDYRGRDVFLAQANSDAVSPFLSTPKWGVLWDTGTAAHFRSRARQVEFHSVAGNLVRYHVCIGESSDEVIARYRALTGAAQLLPKWAYGFWQSKERYDKQSDLTNVVDEYQRRKLPIDVIVQDWGYWGENDRFSGMTFDPVRFPNPKGMVEHVHRAGVRILASIWPAFGPNTAIYKEMEAGAHLFPSKHWSGARVFDASSPVARDIYWKHVKRGILDVGFDGLWTDGVEPELLATGDRYGTAAAYAANGKAEAGPIAEHLLTYSYYQAQGLAESWKRDLPQKRPVLLSRSAYAGQQKFGAITWSGDIFSSWGTLTNQVIAGQNMSAAGIPHWTCDIGAFLVFHRYPKGLSDPAFKELYVRWFQFVAFLSTFRAHGTHVPRELWRFGEPGDKFYDALEKTLRLRYALTPYIYSRAADVFERGESFIRPLALAFPQDPLTRDKPMSYMFGQDLLVTVVDRPFEYASENIQEFLPSHAIRGRRAPAARLEYFEGDAFQKKVSERLTDDLRMSWSGDLPAALSGKPYSTRYTGIIVAQEDGPHEFVVMGKGAIRFWFGGKLVVDASGLQAAADGASGAVSFKEHTGDSRHRFVVALQEGRHYDFRLEQRQKAADTVSLWVEWITPSQRRKMALPASKSVATYLPKGERWYDFETGRSFEGGQEVATAIRLDHMPIFVRSGAILPLTPGRMRAHAPLTEMQLRVYPGRDGAMEIYDDGGDGHGHLVGEKARIPVNWDDKSRVLTLGARKGSFPGMARTMAITAAAVGGSITAALSYVGQEIRVRL
jgi:alpha-D-xyloside xylohydrolase